jgi:hypothetical protein
MVMSQVDNVKNNNTDAQYAQYRAEKKKNLEKILPSGTCKMGVFVKGATAKKAPAITRPGAAIGAIKDRFEVNNFVTVQKSKEALVDIINPWTSYIDEVGTWESIRGKKFDCLHTFQPWYDPNDRTGGEIVKSSIFGRRYKGNYQEFPAEFCQIAAGRGALPLITWEYRGLDFGGDRDVTKLPFEQLIDEIEAGKKLLTMIEQGNAKPEDLNQYAFFKYMLEWARAAKAYGGPLIVRPFHEMTGNWYMASIVANGGGLDNIKDGLIKRFPEYKSLLLDKNNRPKTDGDQNFIVAWCLMYDVFNKMVGASNVYFMFAPNWESKPKYGWNSMEAIYPGNEHTDIVGVSGHKTDSDAKAENMYEGPIQRLQKMTKGQVPIALPEWSSGKFTSRPDFIKKMYELEMKYGVRLSVGFWVDKEDNWIPADTGSVKAEQAAAANKYFSGDAVKGFDPDKAIAKNKYYLDQIYNENLKKTEALVGYNESKANVDAGESYLDNSKISLRRIPKILRRDNALKLNFVKTVEDLLKNIDFLIVDDGVKEKYADILVKNLAEVEIHKLITSEESMEAAIKELEAKYADLEKDVKDAVAVIFNKDETVQESQSQAKQEPMVMDDNYLSDLSRNAVSEKAQKKTIKLTLPLYLRYLILPEIIKAARNGRGAPLSKSDIENKRISIINSVAANTERRIAGSKGKEGGEWSVITNPTVSPAKKIAEGLIGELLTKMISDAVIMPSNEYEYLEAINSLKDKFFGWIESGNNYFDVDYGLIAMRADRGKNRNGGLFRDPTIVGGYQLTVDSVDSVDEKTEKVIKTPYVSPTINICQEIEARMSDPAYLKSIRLIDAWTVKLGNIVVMGGKNERAIIGYKASAAAKISEVMLDFYDSTSCSDIKLLDKAGEKIDDAERLLKQKLALSYEVPIKKIWRDFKSMLAGQSEDYYLYVNIQMARAKLLLEYASNPTIKKEAAKAKKEEALKIYRELLRDSRLGEKRVDILEGIKDAYKASNDPQLMTIALSLTPELNTAQKKNIRKAGGLDKELETLQEELDIHYRK